MKIEEIKIDGIYNLKAEIRTNVDCRKINVFVKVFQIWFIENFIEVYLIGVDNRILFVCKPEELSRLDI